MKIIIFFTCLAAVTLARRHSKSSEISSQKLNPDTNSDPSQDHSSGHNGHLQLGRSLVNTGPGNFVYPLVQSSLGKLRKESFQEDSQNAPQTAKIEKRTGIDDVRDSDETGNFNSTPKSESESRQVVYAGYKPETGFYSVYFPTLNNIPFISGAPLDWNGATQTPSWNSGYPSDYSPNGNNNFNENPLNPGQSYNHNPVTVPADGNEMPQPYGDESTNQNVWTGWSSSSNTYIKDTN